MATEGYRMGAGARACACRDQRSIPASTRINRRGKPIFGDILDVFFKSHRRNIAILKRELARIEAKRKTKEETWRNERDRKDGRRESEDAVLGSERAVSQGGRAGGTLTGRIALGGRAEKRATERPAGATRVRKIRRRRRRKCVDRACPEVPGSVVAGRREGALP